MPANNYYEADGLINRLLAIQDQAMRIILCIFSFIISLSTIAEVSQPSLDDLKTWKIKGASKFEFYDDKFVEIYLTNHERAFLVPVDVGGGRNNEFQTALAIPAKNELILLEGTIVKSVEQVLDVDNNNISEIFVKDSGSGQGAEIGERAIVQIEPNGHINILIKFAFSDNEGEWGDKVSSYHSEDVNWEFTKAPNEAYIDMTETITIKKGVNKKAPIVKTKINHYHFDGHKLVKFTS